MTVRSPLPPDSAAKAVAHRLRMAAAARSFSGGDCASRALAVALKATALGRLSAEEREWSARIEGRQLEIAEFEGVRTPDQLGVFDIRRAVRWMSVPPVLGRLLMRLVRELQPASCLELGTGFGISGAYLAAGLQLNGAGRLITVDVDPRPAAIAAEGFAALGLDQVRVRSGAARDVLAEALAEAGPFDFVFLDADHREEAAVETLEMLEPRLVAGAVIVVDDIAASWPGMTGAWRRISTRPGILDAHHLGRFGIALAR